MLRETLPLPSYLSRLLHKRKRWRWRGERWKDGNKRRRRRGKERRAKLGEEKRKPSEWGLLRGTG